MDIGNKLARAKQIQKSLGTRVAAGYLRGPDKEKPEVSLEAALWWLLGREVKDYETRIRATAAGLGDGGAALWRDRRAC